MVVRLCANSARKIVLDLSSLEFVDSTGLYAILTSWRVCQDHGVGFVLTPAHGAVERMLELTGMSKVLPFARVAV
jgi:anti-anti-sigma factor